MAKKSRPNKVRAPDSLMAARGARSEMTVSLPMWWPWLFCPLLALWLSLSQLHRNHIADSLLPSLVSTMKWTPFFWRQNRYGMLWPLVCSFIHHPLLNVVAVMFCNVTAGLAAHFLLARFLWRDAGPWQWTGLVSIVVTFLVGSERFIFETLSPLQFMTTPLALGLMGLFWLEWGRANPVRLVGACCSFACVSWYNPAACVLLGALMFWAGVLELPFLNKSIDNSQRTQRWMRWLGCLGAVCLSLAFGAWLMRRAQYHNPVFDQGLPFDLWWQTARALTLSMFTPTGDDQGSPWLAASGGALSIACSIFIRWHRTPTLIAAWRRAAAGILAAVCYGGVVSQRAWARQEHCNARYFFPVLFILVSATCVLLVALAQTQSFARNEARAGQGWTGEYGVARPSGFAALILICLCTGLRFGMPSYAGVERWVTSWTGEVGDELIELQCTHVTGRYWDAWPAAFYVNWQRYLRNDTRPFFAISAYAEPTAPMWPADRASWRVGVLRTSPQDAVFFVRRYHLPNLQVRESTAHVLLATIKSNTSSTAPYAD